MRRSLVPFLLVAVLAAACTGATRTAAPGQPAGSSMASPSSSGPVATHHLTILGAASLRSVLDDAKTAYEAANPGTVLEISTDSSAALAAQIEQGAYADVFLSADTDNVQRLVVGGFAEGEATAFAGNALVIVVPDANAAGIESWTDLADEGLKVIAAGEEVPITRYAEQLIANLAALPDAPAGFAEAYAANIVSREDNVKAVVAKLELAEGDAGIVYVTDAAAPSDVAIIELPNDANVPATYAGVVLKASDDVLRAESFLGWFTGPDGQAILARHGFLPPPA